MEPSSSAKRTCTHYLGRVDSETGEIIPTGGKRGRKRRVPAEVGEETPVSPAQYENAVQSLEQAQQMLNDQERRISQLETESAALKAVLRSRHTKSSVLSPYNCSVNSRNIDEASGRSRICSYERNYCQHAQKGIQRARNRHIVNPSDLVKGCGMGASTIFMIHPNKVPF